MANAQTDAFWTHPANLDSPVFKGFSIDTAKSDTVELPFVTRAIYTGSGGVIKVVLKDDTDAVTFANVSAGVILPIRCKQVYTSITTAINILGLY